MPLIPLSGMLLLLSPAFIAPKSTHTFTVYSEEISLRFGEVYEKEIDPVKLPDSVQAQLSTGVSQMLIKSYTADLVRTNSAGEEESAPLTDLYFHHIGPAAYVSNCTEWQQGCVMAALPGEGTGAEFRRSWNASACAVCGSSSSSGGDGADLAIVVAAAAVFILGVGGAVVAGLAVRRRRRSTYDDPEELAKVIPS